MAIYDRFAQAFSDAMGETGDAVHQTQIDPYVYAAVGTPSGKTIYDIGCGNGYMARHFAKAGAVVYGSDISERLLGLARDKSHGLPITYRNHDATDFSAYAPDMFDAVVMNMSIHYIRDLAALCRGVAGVLKPGGVFAFSTNHFLRPASPYSDWEEGLLHGKPRLFIKLTGYLAEERRMLLSWWDKKTKIPLYNHPLHEYVNSLGNAGLYVQHVDEPESVGFAKRYPAALRRTHRIPTYIIIRAVKLP